MNVYDAYAGVTGSLGPKRALELYYFLEGATSDQAPGYAVVYITFKFFKHTGYEPNLPTKLSGTPTILPA
jgi:hypothetical protein